MQATAKVLISNDKKAIIYKYFMNLCLKMDHQYFTKCGDDHSPIPSIFY